MDAVTRRLVAARAQGCCEYCQLPEAASPYAPLQMEHIIAKKHGGTDDDENLAIACFHCNCHKGSDLAGLDPESKVLTRLFHPRKDHWHSHFVWHGVEIRGISSIGRTTVAVLQMNSRAQREVREALQDEQ